MTAFFEEQSEASLVKATIVSKYFFAWGNVIGSSLKKFNTDNTRFAYIDLYAGPGRYRDGTASTPVLVLENAISKPLFRDNLITLFNDGDQNAVQTLKVVIERIKDIGTMKSQPIILNKGVEEDFIKIFESSKNIPMFTFLDPFGYKGLSLKLVNSVIKDWGCDAVFFFNYQRINAGIDNDSVRKHMDSLFGSERVDNIRKACKGLRPAEREYHIMENFCAALREIGGSYVLPFRFRKGIKERTTHFLVFVSKHFKGYEIMKDIMHAESTRKEQDVATFSYSEADKNFPFLFGFTRKIDELKSELPKQFAREKISVQQIYERHSPDTPYIMKNYKKALIDLENEGIVTMTLSASERRVIKGTLTLAPHVLVTFR